MYLLSFSNILTKEELSLGTRWCCNKLFFLAPSGNCCAVLIHLPLGFVSGGLCCLFSSFCVLSLLPILIALNYSANVGINFSFHLVLSMPKYRENIIFNETVGHMTEFLSSSFLSL